MLFETWHLWNHNLTLALFEHDHRWLHIIVHIVMVVMPILMAGIIALTLFRLVRAYIAFLSRSKRTKHVEASYHRIPRRLITFIKRYTFKSQVFLSLGALVTLPITYASLELPKQIINSAINSSNFANSDIAASMNQVDYLLILCGLFLIVLILNGVLKFYLNYYKGSVAELLIKRLRLYIFKKQRTSSKLKSKENFMPVIIQEVEPVCGFSGDSFAIPLLHGGTALSILTFMLVQNLALGAAAITLLPIQILIIPRFQRKINRLVRERVLAVRKLSNRINNNDDRHSGHNHKEIRLLFSNLHNLRMKIFKTKYTMKALNNFIMNLTPFFFYTIGGYLVIEGKLSLGALVASLASYKDLASSIRELFSYYQTLQDAKIRYREIYVFLQRI